MIVLLCASPILAQEWVIVNQRGPQCTGPDCEIQRVVPSYKMNSNSNRFTPKTTFSLPANTVPESVVVTERVVSQPVRVSNTSRTVRSGPSSIPSGILIGVPVQSEDCTCEDCTCGQVIQTPSQPLTAATMALGGYWAVGPGEYCSECGKTHEQLMQEQLANTVSVMEFAEPMVQTNRTYQEPVRMGPIARIFANMRDNREYRQAKRMNRIQARRGN